MCGWPTASEFSRGVLTLHHTRKDVQGPAGFVKGALVEDTEHGSSCRAGSRYCMRPSLALAPAPLESFVALLRHLHGGRDACAPETVRLQLCYLPGVSLGKKRGRDRLFVRDPTLLPSWLAFSSSSCPQLGGQTISRIRQPASKRPTSDPAAPAPRDTTGCDTLPGHAAYAPPSYGMTALTRRRKADGDVPSDVGEGCALSRAGRIMQDTNTTSTCSLPMSFHSLRAMTTSTRWRPVG